MPTSNYRDAGAPTAITPALLRGWPLPRLDEGGDKNDRGSVLVAGGTVELPGAVVLAATGALRAGAGKLQIATVRDVAVHVAIAIPEARVFGLAQTSEGGIDPAEAPALAERLTACHAALLGPGMMNQEATALMLDVIPRIKEAALVLDAGALLCLAADRGILRTLNGNVVLTPHAGEMADMLGVDAAEIARDPAGIAVRAAGDLGAVVALKGANTFVATPSGALYCYRSKNIGLATSGSGDTLSGVIAGLIARGGSPDQATAWGVYLHGTAGARLATRVGGLGFLARELLAEIPPIMAELS